MDVKICEKHLAHISQLIDSGRYSTADAVIDRALALLEERDLADTDPAIEMQLADLRAKVMHGIDDLRHGRYTQYETADELVADISRMGREQRDREASRKEAFVG